MSGMGIHRGTPGRHHRRPTPHFWRFAVSHRQRKERWIRKTGVTPAEVQAARRAEAARRVALIGLCVPCETQAVRGSWRDTLAELLERDVAA